MPIPARLMTAHIFTCRTPGTQFCLPGFDEPVSLTEIDDWITQHAPHVSPLRRATYAHDYDVAGKIRRAKRG